PAAVFANALTVGGRHSLRVPAALDEEIVDLLSTPALEAIAGARH
ncbi:MAG: hypothetical protein HQ546_02080, partial [Planctomycetes bacterium]|nr:hypothetical protein [Planctomycetota bacterium]